MLGTGKDSGPAPLPVALPTTLLDLDACLAVVFAACLALPLEDSLAVALGVLASEVSLAVALECFLAVTFALGWVFAAAGALALAAPILFAGIFRVASDEEISRLLCLLRRLASLNCFEPDRFLTAHNNSAHNTDPVSTFTQGIQIHSTFGANSTAFLLDSVSCSHNCTARVKFSCQVPFCLQTASMRLPLHLDSMKADHKVLSPQQPSTQRVKRESGGARKRANQKEKG